MIILILIEKIITFKLLSPHLFHVIICKNYVNVEHKCF
jgi:hypothetical protein